VGRVCTAAVDPGWFFGWLFVCLPATLLKKHFVIAKSMDGMDLVLVEVDTKVPVVVVDPEGNAAVVVLEVPLRVVLVVAMGKVYIAAIKGHELTVVVALDLDEIATKVCNDEGAIVAMVVSLSTQATALSDEVAAIVGPQAYGNTIGVDAVALRWRVGVARRLQCRHTDLLRRIAALLGRVAALLGRIAALLGRIAALLGRVAALLERVAALLGRVAALLGRVAALLERVAALLGRVAALLGGTERALLGRVAALLGRVAALLRRVAALLGRVAALLGRDAALLRITTRVGHMG